MRRTLPYLIIVLTTLPVFAADHPYLLGRGIADVTGPARGAQMWGFVRDGQITEGIHTRLFSRAFIIAERDKPESRIAFVSIDIGSTTHDMQLEVVEQLQKKYAEAYSLHNVILSATHTHSGPGGYWHWGGDSPLGSSFSQAHFDTIVNGIVQSISEAHDELAPGSIQLNQGSVEGAGANRSITAYDANPAEERARYDSTTDKGMTLLKLTNDSGPIGMINWFASHPTAMTFDNCLISGDHKGYASQQFEKSIGNNFVAAFAQTNCGDVTPNLNLNNTGPGQNEFETTRIIGERQLTEAQRLFTAASTPIAGPIKSHQIYIDFTYRPIDAAYTSGAGPQRTCPSAMGYSMGAGSTEDGGGHPMLKEGMTERVPFIDGTVKNLFNPPEPSDECRECHDMKPILFSTGEPDPPLQTQILPITLTQIGQLTFASMPAEVTTMSGRRLRDTLAQTHNTPQENIIIICYANDYGGYITTHEEYTTQQYEGGHTLFGPWTLAAYQQEFDQLAKAMLKGEYPEPTTAAADKRSSAQSTPLLDPATPQPTSPKPIGTIATQPKTKAKPGKQVQASFYAIDPRINFPQS
ncbi:MAG: neutral/alkaline non-lysosomal ceramidase N-terminal domain-containing protein, partial [Candidatus Hydrogenedentota bacterium]